MGYQVLVLHFAGECQSFLQAFLRLFAPAQKIERAAVATEHFGHSNLVLNIANSTERFLLGTQCRSQTSLLLKEISQAVRSEGGTPLIVQLSPKFQRAKIVRKRLIILAEFYKCIRNRIIAIRNSRRVV